jgi:hypothetical protein
MTNCDNENTRVPPMKRACAVCLAIAAVIWLMLPGCILRRPDCGFHDADLEHYKSVATQIEFPDTQTPAGDEVAMTMAPMTLRDDGPPKFKDVSLEEAIQTALSNSQVLRDLGGTVLQSPGNTRTIQGPAIQETDPRFGVDAALSAFDAVFSSKGSFEKNDRSVNNPFFSRGATLAQDIGRMDTSITKRAATGTQYTIGKTIDYDFNNTPGNPLSGAWDVLMDAEFRHPLLQGSGVDFNRIAGPFGGVGLIQGLPGTPNGVLIARVNTDISLADFELGVRNFVNDVENAYWDLYFAYRDLDSRIATRNQALETWRVIKENVGRGGFEAYKEAEFREKYFEIEAQVQDALSGKPIERTRTLPFRAASGVQAHERRLRLMMGLPISDGCLIRPCTEPTMAKVEFDWSEVLCQALTRRVELRRQKWQIKRRELELLAFRNFLLPRLDAFGRYRWRGFGKNLLFDDKFIDIAAPGDPPPGNLVRNNAFKDLVSGDFQEWQLGFEMTMPIGFRQAHAAVRNAQLNLARDVAILEEQEREVVHDLSSAFGELERAYAIAQTYFNARVAVKQWQEALEASDLKVREPARYNEALFDAQRRLADIEGNYYRAMVEYSLAIKQVHFAKGSLLEYNGVYLAEGPWPDHAYRDAQQRDALRGRSWDLNNFVLRRPAPVSQGQYPQHVLHGALDHSGFEEVSPADSNEHRNPLPTPPNPLTSPPANGEPSVQHGGYDPRPVNLNQGLPQAPLNSGPLDPGPPAGHEPFPQSPPPRTRGPVVSTGWQNEPRP